MPPTDDERESHEQESIDLKDPWVAAILAWLIPGLGHLYQGRFAKAGLFFVCIMSTFFYGLSLGSDWEPNDDKDLGWGRVVYFSWREGENMGGKTGEGDKRLPYLCQVGIGLPALPALAQAKLMQSNQAVWCNGLMAPPRLSPTSDQNDPNHKQPTLDDLNKYLHPYFELGTVYTMIAGLLNVLAIYDAWGGPVFSETAKKDEEEEQEGQKDQEGNGQPESTS